MRGDFMRTCYNCYWGQLGYVRNNVIYDGNNNAVGYFNGRTIYNNSDDPLGYFDGNGIYNYDGRYSGYLYGNTVFNTYNYPVGFVSNAFDFLLAAALIFLLL